MQIRLLALVTAAAVAVVPATGSGKRMVRAAKADASANGGGDWPRRRRQDNTEVLKELGVELENEGKIDHS